MGGGGRGFGGVLEFSQENFIRKLIRQMGYCKAYLDYKFGQNTRFCCYTFELLCDFTNGGGYGRVYRPMITTFCPNMYGGVE